MIVKARCAIHPCRRDVADGHVTCDRHLDKEEGKLDAYYAFADAIDEQIDRSVARDVALEEILAKRTAELAEDRKNHRERARGQRWRPGGP